MALDPRETDPVAQLVDPAGARRRRTRAPAGDLHLCRHYADGGVHVAPYRPEDGPPRPGASIVAVSPHPFPVRLSFRNVRTGDGVDADIAVEMRCRIADAVAFLREVGLPLLAGGAVGGDAVAEALQQRHAPEVRRAAADMPYRDLRARGAMTDLWPALLGPAAGWCDRAIRRVTVVSAAGEARLRAEDAAAAEARAAEARARAREAAAAEADAALLVVQAEHRLEVERLEQERRRAALAPVLEPSAPVAKVAAAPAALLDERDGLAAVARRRAAEAPGMLRVARGRADPRDLGFRPVDAVRVGDAVSFAIAAGAAGYLTLLLHGSSGRVILLAPNAFCGIEDAFMAPDEHFLFPSPQLLGGRRLETIQDGPAGPEQVVALLSEAPLIEAADLSGALAAGGLATLDGAALRRIAGRLRDGGAGTWFAGAASYEVAR